MRLPAPRWGKDDWERSIQKDNSRGGCRNTVLSINWTKDCQTLRIWKTGTHWHS
ncbi:hypothetical protein RSAG8_12596, partial [Rhizoctonia solani AG-8 WAC10335]